MNQFDRNSRIIINDVKELTHEAFLTKYSEIMNEDILSRVYTDTRKALGIENEPVPVAIPDGKMVTFKVIRRSKDYVDPKPEMKVVKDDTDQV